MPTPTNRPAADPVDPTSNEKDPSPAAGDVYIDATRAVAEEERDPDQARIEDDRESARVAGGDPDIVPPAGEEDEGPIGEAGNP